ncbi:hypothetical protein V6Z12_D01G249800 [Gossypium hirsutum]
MTSFQVKSQEQDLCILRSGLFSLCSCELCVFIVNIKVMVQEEEDNLER